LDPNFAKSLQILTFEYVPAGNGNEENLFHLKSKDFSISVLARWILSVCLNIHTIEVKFPIQLNGLFNEIGRLKKLKKLDVTVYKASDLKEVTLILLIIMTTLLISP
jgi:hypothetical protein